MIIETCPICGGDLMPYVITTYPPIIAKKCLKCDFRWEEKQDEIIRVKFEPKNNSRTCINSPTIIEAEVEE